MLTHVALSIAILTQTPLDDERAPTLDDEQAPAHSEREGCFDDKELRIRQTKLGLGLGLGSAGAFLISGLTLLIAREKPVMTDDGPVCTVGKPCGNSCIAVEYECHQSPTGSLGPVTRTGWIVGGTFFAVGVGLLIAAFIAPRRLQPKRIKCDLSGCSLAIKF